MSASRRGHVRMVLELLYYGADASIDYQVPDTGDTALFGMTKRSLISKNDV